VQEQKKKKIKTSTKKEVSSGSSSGDLLLQEGRITHKSKCRLLTMRTAVLYYIHRHTMYYSHHLDAKSPNLRAINIAGPFHATKHTGCTTICINLRPTLALTLRPS